MIRNWDNSRSRVSILSCNARPIRSHKIKRVAHYCRLCVVGGKSALNRHFLVIEHELVYLEKMDHNNYQSSHMPIKDQH
jgi:hypothetical protein